MTETNNAAPANPGLLRDIEDVLHDELWRAEIDIHALALQLFDTVQDGITGRPQPTPTAPSSQNRASHDTPS